MTFEKETKFRLKALEAKDVEIEGQIGAIDLRLNDVDGDLNSIFDSLFEYNVHLTDSLNRIDASLASLDGSVAAISNTLNSQQETLNDLEQRVTALENPAPPEVETIFGAYPGYLNYGDVYNLPAQRARVRTNFGGLPAERIFVYGLSWPVIPHDAKALIISFNRPMSDWYPDINGNFPAKQWFIDNATALAGIDNIYWDVQHEPDQEHRVPGEAYKPALKSLQTLGKSINKNWKFGPILMNYSIIWGPGVTEYLDEAWDFIGWDVYYRSWQLGKTPNAAALMAPSLKINQDWNKPMIIGELGMGGPMRTHIADNPQDGLSVTQRTAFVTDMIALARANKVHAVCWFETNKYDIDSVLEPHDNPENGHVEWPAAYAAYKDAVLASL